MVNTRGQRPAAIVAASPAIGIENTIDASALLGQCPSHPPAYHRNAQRRIGFDGYFPGEADPYLG